ncbi:MAG: hypothetical protein JXB00_00215 [Bacteroidales bacterium]|nr:hypothetical protein [Bacteroidales bacterium]
MKYCLIFCFLMILVPDCFSLVPSPFPYVTEDDLPGARFEKPKIYTRESLYGYINGAAELYLEYGFTNAWICEIIWMGGKYTAEIYRMGNPEDAFGIFSVSRWQCKNVPSLSPFSCHTRYQLQVCSGSFYISIINGTASSTDSITPVKIAQAIVRKIHEAPADISYYLPGLQPETINQKAILARGRLGVMNGAPDWEDFFESAKGYTTVILHEGDTIFLSVRFTTKEDLNGFMVSRNWDPQTINTEKTKMPTGEIVSLISDHHLLIEMRTTI